MSRWLFDWAMPSRRAALSGSGPAAPPASKPERPRDRGQRRAQFVADGGHEFAFEALDPAPLGRIAADRKEMAPVMQDDRRCHHLGFEGRAVVARADEGLR